MKAKSIFSKIVAGIGALAMVATMMPAMATTARAATVEMTKPENAKVYEYPTSNVARNLGNPEKYLTEAEDGTAATEYELTVGNKYVLVPNNYYEYTNTAPRISYDDGTSILAMNPVVNEYFTTSYIFTVPDNVESVYIGGGKTYDDYFPLEADPPKPIEVIITVNVGDGISAYARSLNPYGAGGKSIAENSSITFRVTREENDGKVIYKVNGDPILPNATVTSSADIFGDWGTFETGDVGGPGSDQDLTPNAYSSPIIITAAKKNVSARDFTFTVDNLDANGKGVTGALWSKSEVVGLPDSKEDRAFSKYEGDKTAAEPVGDDELDDTSYVSVYKLNDEVVDVTTPNTHGIDPAKLAKGTAGLDLKAELPEKIAKNVEFVINPEDIFRLYALGYASADDKAMDGGTDNRTSGYRNGAFKYINIYLGYLAETDVEYKWENGADITGDKSVANTYNFAYVFRDVNGKRFDSEELLVSTYDNSWSADPGEWPWDGKKGLGFNAPYTEEGYDTLDNEGDTVSFKLMIDPLYAKGSNFDPEKNVYVWAYDDDTAKRHAVRDLIKYDAATDTYTFTAGNEGPYRIVAENIVPASTGIVRAIPQSDAIFGGGRTHTENLSWVNQFYRYDEFGGNGGLDENGNTMGLSCNVLNPRFQWFIKAHEEDDVYFDLMSFAMPGAVATTVDWNGHAFPVGEHKFKLRFSNAFVKDANGGPQHGVFNNDVTDDRYALGSDGIVTVTVDGTKTTLTPDENGLYTIKVEADKTYDLRVEGTDGFEGVATNFKVQAPNVAGYNIEANFPVDRETTGDNFVSMVPGGSKYRFKINFSEGYDKGPDFKVELAQISDTGMKGDYIDSVQRTTARLADDGWYEFEVNNDTQIIISGVTGGSEFSDVSGRTDEEQKAIKWLQSKGILGFEDGTFRPDASTKRGEFVRMLYMVKNGTAGSTTFSDTTSHWAKDEIGWAAGEKSVNGYPDGTFKPDRPISRAEVAQVIWKMAGSQAGAFTAPFSDVSQGAWYAPAINWAYSESVVNGIGDNLFSPNAPIQRAHIALILHRANGMY